MKVHEQKQMSHYIQDIWGQGMWQDKKEYTHSFLGSFHGDGTEGAWEPSGVKVGETGAGRDILSVIN